MLTADEIVQRLERTTEQAPRSLGYSEVRHYVLRNSRFNRDAEMEVRAIRNAQGGLEFTILKLSGSEHIFRQILEGEATLSRLPAATGTLEVRNYEFKLVGRETIGAHLCHVLQLIPRRKSKYLLEGRVWIDAVSFGLVRLEGRPTASLSFLVGRPLILQDFEKVSGAWVVLASHTTASTRLLGTTQLSIEHRDRQFTADAGNVANLRALRIERR